jgi:hypothetical protein
MTNQSYEGWSNYETWAVNLHMKNDQDACDYWMSETRNCLGVGDLAEEMKDHFQNLAPTLEGVYADLLNTALSEVNWREIATTWIADSSEETENDTLEG